MSAWREVCRLDRLPVERGVTALVDGEQVAVFRTVAGALHALGNCDPFSDAMVLARGVVGSRGDRATVSSPMYKQVFDLETGECLDQPEVRVGVHHIRVVEGIVEVALSRAGPGSVTG